MIKRIYLCCLVLVALFGSHGAFAARHFQAVGDGRLIGGKTGDSFTCEDFSSQTGPIYRVDGSCQGLDAAIQAANQSYPGYFHWINSKYNMDVEVSVYVVGGSCKAGGDAGHYEVPAGYGYPANGQITQAFGDPAPFSVSGCMVALSADLSCYTKSGDGEVAPGIKLVYCDASFKETGEPGGGNGSPSVTQDPYSGGGNTGGGGSGGGTDPGTGGDGGGGTDPGTGGGGGGGTDPGTGGGGGGTDPGAGGGGGTNPGTGGGGDGTDFCARHPGSSICQNSGVSGNCENFVCTGDAIQCATLREVHDANCKIAADEVAANGSGIGKLGKGVIDGNDPDVDKLPRPGNGAEVSVPSLDLSGWLGGGECFTDKTVFIQGREITIPFSKACGALIVLRYAIMIVAALASFKMLSGAIIRE